MLASDESQSELPERADVVVAGGGAAGMMAALHAAGRGRRAVLLEKNSRLGLKILISGGGRCNLTTSRSGRDLEAEYGTRRGRWLRSALRSFSPRELVRMIEDGGVPLQEEDLEKIFPVSGRAGDVLACLLGLVRNAGVAVVPSAPVLDVIRERDGGFCVNNSLGAVRATSLILATGGLSYPKTGSTGDGYRIAGALGHGLVPTVAHLAPLAVSTAWVRELAGIVLNDSAIAVANSKGEVLCRRRRPILFTHKGLSGPGPMDLSGFVEEQGCGCEVLFDFVPDMSSQELERGFLDQAARHGRRAPANLLPRELPERLRHTLAWLAGATGNAAELSRESRSRLLRTLKECRVPVEGSLGLGHAEVTRGGIPLEEVEPGTMRSKLVPGLFLCGEVLDVDGPIGGFNFQAAFATGRLAGLHA